MVSTQTRADREKLYRGLCIGQQLGENRALIQPLKCNSNLLSRETASLGFEPRRLISTHIITHHKCMSGQLSNAFISQVHKDIASNSHLSSLPSTQKPRKQQCSSVLQTSATGFYFALLRFMDFVVCLDWAAWKGCTNTYTNIEKCLNT